MNKSKKNVFNENNILTKIKKIKGYFMFIITRILIVGEKIKTIN
jgi:hypothetical protein